MAHISENSAEGLRHGFIAGLNDVLKTRSLNATPPLCFSLWAPRWQDGCLQPQTSAFTGGSLVKERDLLLETWAKVLGPHSRWPELDRVPSLAQIAEATQSVALRLDRRESNPHPGSWRWNQPLPKYNHREWDLPEENESSVTRRREITRREQKYPLRQLKTHRGPHSGVTDGNDEKMLEELRNSRSGLSVQVRKVLLSTETVGCPPGLLIKAFPHKLQALAPSFTALRLLSHCSEES